LEGNEVGEGVGEERERENCCEEKMGSIDK
jgi:hypothetical protein